MLHAGENEIELTVPEGELTTGVVYDYLRLELDEAATPPAPENATPPASPAPVRSPGGAGIR